MLRFQVHSQTRKFENLLRFLLNLADFSLFFVGRRNAGEAVHLVEFTGLEGVIEPVSQTLHRRKVVDAARNLFYCRHVTVLHWPGGILKKDQICNSIGNGHKGKSIPEEL